ncbi:MAG: amidohydrolase family protein [Planctomycetes bacterium]|nr:amidohydrolase family protein [Planctomycetota bacterium]
MIYLTHAAVLDASGENFSPDSCIVVVGGRIAQVGACSSVLAPTGATTVDLTGLHVLPGLIDLHSHLLLHPYNEAKWDDQVLRESIEIRTIRATVAARKTLEAGFTTLRDLGTEGAGFADVALRDAIASNLIPGPRVFASTRAIVATGCYGPSGFDPRWDMPKGAQVADGVDGVRRAVREQVAAGADWIKFYADYRRNGSETTVTFSQAEMDAIVDEAHSAGLPVAAHATIEDGIRRAVLAGVQTIEHGYGASDEVLKMMHDRGVFLCPTLTAIEMTSTKFAGWKRRTPEPEALSRARDLIQRALRAGVTITNGSDVGVFAHGDNARELELMVEFGMTPREAIRAATTIAAKVLRKDNELGRIERGYLADFVAVRGDPLENISHTRDVVLVIKDGKVVVDHRSKP